LRIVPNRPLVLAALLFLLLPARPAHADEATPGADARQAELDASWDAAGHAAIKGPATVTLLDQAKLQIPQGEAFVPQAEADRLMRAFGNQTDPTRFGLVVGTGDDDQWIVAIRFIKDGYIKDDDAKDWQPDTMLQNLRAGTEAGNKDRIARGFPAMDILGWVQPPAYDAATHRLVWSMSLKDRGAPDDRPRGINYNTYALGRDGYFSLNLLTNTNHVEADKPVVRNLLASLDYDAGKRYQDFDGSTDKVAEYGLAALIGVVAVKKLGLLAGLGVLLLKTWKIGMLAIVGAGAAVKRFFKRA
jgi:uncharacterized membrane-anchored protein